MKTKALDRIIIVHYIDVRHIEEIGASVSEYMQKATAASSEMIRDDMDMYFIPVRQDSRIECINPKLVDEDAYKEAKILLDQHLSYARRELQKLKIKAEKAK